jgi:hypothetical protein
MPVLDARALKTDPKGVAFLLSVLRHNPTSHPNDTSKPSPTLIRLIKRRTGRLQDGVTGL